MAQVKLLAVTPNAEKLIENAGRTCYKSFEKINEGSHIKFIRMIIKNRHFSVLEHASATFKVVGGSRCFTHQMVRHRLCSFSQQSQRYVDENDFSVVVPQSIKEDSSASSVYLNYINTAKDTYKRLRELGIKKEDARFVLPNAVTSEIIISGNFRQLRHIFDERYKKAAQWEIREIVGQMLKEMKRSAPTVFEDYVN